MDSRWSTFNEKYLQECFTRPLFVQTRALPVSPTVLAGNFSPLWKFARRAFGSCASPWQLAITKSPCNIYVRSFARGRFTEAMVHATTLDRRAFSAHANLSSLSATILLPLLRSSRVTCHVHRNMLLEAVLASSCCCAAMTAIFRVRRNAFTLIERLPW